LTDCVHRKFFGIIPVLCEQLCQRS